MNRTAKAVLDAEVEALGRAPWAELVAREGEQLWEERQGGDDEVYAVAITSMWDDPRDRDCLRLMVEVFKKIGPGHHVEDWTSSLGTLEVVRTQSGVVGVGPVRDLADAEFAFPRLDLRALLRRFR